MAGLMPKKKHCDGFLGCRTPKYIEHSIKAICDTHNRDVSEVINYLCRVFIEDVDGVRSKFLNAGNLENRGIALSNS